MALRNEHIRAEELFSAYIDHRATADEQTFVERHVALCADCRAKLDATRAMVAVLRKLPMVKAPRSFVLPREMERQARPSILNWYPALRLATVIAVIALVIVFAGDVLIPRSAARNAMLPSSAPAAAPAPMSTTASAVAMEPTKPLPAASQPAPEQSQPKAASSATQSLLPTATAAMAQAYDNTSPSLGITATSPVTVNIPIVVAGAPTIGATPEATPKAFVAAPLSAEQSRPTAPGDRGAAPIDPVRAIEVALAGLVIVLVIATLIARRRMTKT